MLTNIILCKGLKVENIYELFDDISISNIHFTKKDFTEAYLKNSGHYALTTDGE